MMGGWTLSLPRRRPRQQAPATTPSLENVAPRDVTDRTRRPGYFVSRCFATSCLLARVVSAGSLGPRSGLRRLEALRRHARPHPARPVPRRTVPGVDPLIAGVGCHSPEN